MPTLAVKYRPQKFDDVVEQDVLKAILKNQIDTHTIKNCYLFCGPAGCGKAQPLFSKVLTPSGFIEMRDVKAGTKVYTRKGNIASVKNIYPQGTRDVYKITFSDRTSILVADNHLNSVYRYNQDKKCREDFVLETPELISLFEKSRFKLRVDIPIVNFDSQDVPVNPYLIGFLIGDGSLHNNFGFSTSESDLLEKINNILTSEYKCCAKYVGNYDYRIVSNSCQSYYVCYYNGVKYNGVTELERFLKSIKDCSFSSDTLVKQLKVGGTFLETVFPDIVNATIEDNESFISRISLGESIKSLGMCEKSINKSIPKVYLLNDYSTRVKLLQGLFDTDGSISLNGETSWSTSSKQLSDDFSFLVRSLGCRDTVSISNGMYKDRNGNNIECNECYTHYIKFPSDLIFCTSEKLTNRIKKRQMEPHKNIVSIDYYGVEECQCIYVDDPDHTYLSDDFIPTHNTTSARLFAYSLNDSKNNVVELDAASHSGVDNFRQLLEESKLKPIGTQYRIFIIDECHSLSSQAWQSALKQIEEPTPTSIFIFATTDPQKIPPTILSRVQRYDIQRITHAGIVNRLKYILDCENSEGHTYTFDEDGIDYIAKLADGGMRDAITMMEKVLGFSNHIDIDSVTKALGTADYGVMFDLTDAICKMDKKSVIQIIETAYRNGTDLKQFIKNYNNFVLDLTIYDITGTFDYLKIPKTYETRIKNYTKQDFSYFPTLLNEVINLNTTIKWETMPKPIIESTFILLCSEA